MSQSLAAVYIHLVFATKNRFPFLTDGPLRAEMHRYLAGTSNGLDCPALAVGGVADHVHLLARLGRGCRLADWVKELKRASTVWLHGRALELNDFSWQAGYGAFSVSASQLDKARQYVAGQEVHHRQTTFQEEFRALLRAHAVEWDERYAWD